MSTRGRCIPLSTTAWRQSTCVAAGVCVCVCVWRHASTHARASLLDIKQSHATAKRRTHLGLPTATSRFRASSSSSRLSTVVVPGGASTVTMKGHPRRRAQPAVTYPTDRLVWLPTISVPPAIQEKASPNFTHIPSAKTERLRRSTVPWECPRRRCNTHPSRQSPYNDDWNEQDLKSSGQPGYRSLVFSTASCSH